jgi:hypothetical protein
MKNLILMLALSMSISAFSQDTTRIEQYCRLEATGRLFSSKVTIDVDFGEGRKLFSDYRLRDEESGKLKKFNSVTDALNYMGSQGWTLVNAFPVNSTSNSVYHYYFKKLFPKDQL